MEIHLLTIHQKIQIKTQKEIKKKMINQEIYYIIAIIIIKYQKKMEFKI